MFFTISLYISLAIFAVGLLYKVSGWFRHRLGPSGGEIPSSTRIAAAIKGLASTLFSVRILEILKVFVFDVLLQLRVLREDFLRWLMHICIYGGFMLLLLMHALDEHITSALFPGYYPTVNPFMFLRDLFGLLVIVGLALALYRRFIVRVPRLRTGGQDYYAISILAVILISGIFLEGVKITSHSAFQDMVQQYTVMASDEELKALEAYWVEKFGVVSPHLQGPFDQEMLELGELLHEMSCAECHSRPQAAFLGYGTAKAISAFAVQLDRAHMPRILWYIHFLACWLGLAYLPFSKMFHIVASPLSLLANAVMDRERSAPANVATKQMLELDACTHCGTCSLNCSVWVAVEKIPNLNILPSEKIPSLKALAVGKDLSDRELMHIQEGIHLCTNCRRCTVVCPVGINLQDLWYEAKEALLQRGYPEFLALSPLSYYRGLMRKELVDDNYPAPLIRAREAIAAEWDLIKAPEKRLILTPACKDFKNGLGLSDQASNFSVCFGCETCTTVCPVVANYENPQEVLGLLPHQIMHVCALGLRDLAFGSNMLWDCVTCYQCQEQCPQGVWVADVLYELKNRAIQHAKERTSA